MKYGHPVDASCIFDEVVVKDVYRLRSLQNSYSLFLDIGANCGTFSILARMLFPKAAVVALEPFPPTLQMLADNVSNLNINVYANAMAWGTDKVSFRNPYGYSGTVQSFTHTGSGLSAVAAPLPTLFKAAVRDLEPSKVFIKIDTEGSESGLLADPESLEILKSVGAFAMEIHPGESAAFKGNPSQKDWEAWKDPSWELRWVENATGMLYGGEVVLNSTI